MSISMPLVGRLLLAAVCVVAMQWPAWQVDRRTTSVAGTSRLDVAGLPMQLGQWTGVDAEMDERLVKHIGATCSISRSYQNSHGRQVMVHLAAFPSAEVSIPHPPRMCYTSAGWTLGPERTSREKETPPFRFMAVERDGTRAEVVYWYQLGPDIAANRGELRGMLQKLRWKGERWPPLVKILLHVPVDSVDRIAESEATEIGIAIYEWLRSAS